MKLGVHSAIFVKDWEEDITPYIHRCHEAGYNCIEVSLLGQDEYSSEKIGHLSDKLNIEITCTTGLSHDEDITSENISKRDVGIKALERAIDLTSRMNSSILSGVVFAPWGISDSKGLDKDKKYLNSSKSIQSVCNSLEIKKINLAIEPLNRYETDFLNTVDEGLYLCELINHDRVGLLLDSYHMNIEEKNPTNSIKKANEKIFHFHVAENDRGIPGSGSINWEKTFNTLYAINYSKCVTLEMFTQAFVNTSKDLFTWRNIELDPFEAIVKAHKFLKKYIHD